MQLNEAKEFCKQFTGVSIHGNRIRITFTYKGKRCIENLKTTITKSNIKRAVKIRAEVEAHIFNDTFDYGRYFPTSSRVKEFGTAIVPTFSELFAKYLDVLKTKVREKHYNNVKAFGDNYLLPKFGHIPIDKIKKSVIEEFRAVDLSRLSNKSINEIFTPLRAVFKLAMADQIIVHNPMDYIKNLPKMKKNQADPFTMEEIKAMQNGNTHRESERNAALFACFTGMRISEWLAVAWEDVDWQNKTIHIRRGLSEGKLASTKTESSTRVIELLDQAYEILLDQRKYTEMLRPKKVKILNSDNRTYSEEELHFIFLNSISNNLWFDGKNYNNNFFTGFLRQNKIRRRTPNQCRHTFASQCLIRQVPERWIMKQLGWTSIQMFEQHYGKWIDSEMTGMAQKVSVLFKNDPIEIQEKTGIV